MSGTWIHEYIHWLKIYYWFKVSGNADQTISDCWEIKVAFNILKVQNIHQVLHRFYSRNLIFKTHFGHATWPSPWYFSLKGLTSVNIQEVFKDISLEYTFLTRQWHGVKGKNFCVSKGTCLMPVFVFNPQYHWGGDTDSCLFRLPQPPHRKLWFFMKIILF